MSLRKLISVVGANKNVFIHRSLIGLSMREIKSSLVIGNQIIRQRSDKFSLRDDTTKNKNNNYDDDDDENRPIKFSDSGAAIWDPVYSRTGGPLDDEKPWYQTYVIIGSVAIFLIYFCILREENDIDEKLTLQLSDHFEGEQKRNLELSQQVVVEATQEKN